MASYQRVSHREIYSNPWVSVEVHDIIHPTQTAGEHVLFKVPAASAVIVADYDDLLFTRQPRFAAQADVLEIVKGGAGEGETPLECAKREAREELGIVAEHWQSLGFLYEIPSVMETPVHIFLASGITHVDTEFEPNEIIELVRIPRHVAVEAAAAGKINDAITAAALLRYGIACGVLSVAKVETS